MATKRQQEILKPLDGSIRTNPGPDCSPAIHKAVTNQVGERNEVKDQRAWVAGQFVMKAGQADLQ
jgi:hypothetical protein